MSVLLADEGIGAGIERANLRAALFRAGEQQAGKAAQRRIEPDAANDRRAVDAGQHAVDDDGGRAQIGGKAQAVLAAAGDQHAVAGALRALPSAPRGR